MALSVGETVSVIGTEKRREGKFADFLRDILLADSQRDLSGREGRSTRVSRMEECLASRGVLDVSLYT